MFYGFFDWRIQMIRVADYIAQKLEEYGIRHVFLVTGGGAMHLNDAFGRLQKMEYIACHHEQACAMAAESYYRMTNNLAAVNVTTGPGGTNAITGVYGAWTDSIGMLVISGQVKWETLVRSTNLPLRQLGDQEIDIIQVISSITKYAVMIQNPLTIRYHLEKALYLAKAGRPGPVWLDVPMNVQAAFVDPDELKSFNPESEMLCDLKKTKPLTKNCVDLLKQLQEAKRPVILVGTGIRLSDSHSTLMKLVDKLSIPLVTAWNAHDVLWNDHPLYVGRPGTVGDRAGNFAVQNADFLIILGCRLNIRQISYNWKSFARAAYKVMVDVDEAELKKPTLEIDLPIHANLKDFLQVLIDLDYSGPTEKHKNYLSWCLERKNKYPVVLPEYWKNTQKVNPYCFVEALFNELPENELIVTGDGTACVVTFQSANLKKGQRLYTNSGCASMGYDLPAAIGAAFSTPKKRIICITGDGSIQMNIQELQTIVTYNLPIKIFILNNQGYHSIRQTQQNYFPDNVVGCGMESGLGFPDFSKLADCYRIPFHKICHHSELKENILACIQGEGPQICEVVLDLEQQFAPKLSSRKTADGRMISSPLEDLAPFLSREELAENMLIPLWKEG